MKVGSPFVVDTNVLLVANEQHPDVSPGCVIACVGALDNLRKHGIVVLDSRYEILSEYSRRTAPNTGNRVGDGFLKWLYQNSGNASVVESVDIEEHAERGYTKFPTDPELKEFDRSDRKFVAVAASHSERPPILQGTDSKWMRWSDRLAANGVEVVFLCPADTARFLRRKGTIGPQGRPCEER